MWSDVLHHSVDGGGRLDSGESGAPDFSLEGSQELGLVEGLARRHHEALGAEGGWRQFGCSFPNFLLFLR